MTTNRETRGELSEDDLNALRDRLADEREKILALYKKDLAAGRVAASDGPEDFGDRASSDYERDLAFSLSEGERDRLVLIDEALERMDRGEYGVCQHSGEPISLPRLKAVPWARFTAENQEKAEQGLLELS